MSLWEATHGSSAAKEGGEAAMDLRQFGGVCRIMAGHVDVGVYHHASSLPKIAKAVDYSSRQEPDGV